MSQELDSLGRIVDFGVIKEKLGEWIDTYWDHTTILHEDDTKLGKNITAITKQPIYYLPNNPTAENMASYLLLQICPDMFRECGVQCTRIRLYETPNCYADAVLGV